MTRLLRLAVAVLTVVSVPVYAPATPPDLSKVDRTIAKEPAYKTKPKYCLLVFGMEAKHKVWLVVDGDTLYVDRNGNGDLTAPGNKIAAQKNDRPDLDQITFKVPELRVANRVHKNLKVWLPKLDYMTHMDKRVKDIVARDPQARAYYIAMEIEMSRFKGTGLGGRVSQSTSVVDLVGVFQFADRAQDAPIVHFDGPLEITFYGQQAWKIGRQTDVSLAVGSPGVGPGSHTYVEYEGVIPDKAYATLEITHPPAKVGAAAVRERYDLKERC